jgi:hypothetical protein
MIEQALSQSPAPLEAQPEVHPEAHAANSLFASIPKPELHVLSHFPTPSV